MSNTKEAAPQNAESQAKLDRESVLLAPEIKNWWVLTIMGPLERLCLRLGVSPDAITYFGTALCVLCGYLFASNHILSAGWLVLFIGSLDILDGRVARAMNVSGPKGAFLDSVMDRYQDFFMMTGVTIYFKNSWMFFITLFALLGSSLVPYTRAKAESLGIAIADVGAIQRPERFFLLGFGSILSSMFHISLMPFYGYYNPPPQHVLMGVMIVLAVSTNWTALQRIRYTLRAIKESRL